MLQRNIFLLLGSNSGNRSGHLRTAIEFIEKEIGKIIAISRIYETSPWGRPNQPDFLNQAIQIESQFFSNELLSKIQEIEIRLGRTRIEKWGERPIDIDIIYFGNSTIDGSGLVIPHPRLTERKFVLVPLVEISPDFIHPILQKSNTELLKECIDTLPVNEFIN